MKKTTYNGLPEYNEGAILQDPPVEYISKTENERHLRLLEISFHINCSRKIFNEKELECLEKYGAWLEALQLHKIKPITDEQSKFLSQIEQEIQPDNEIAKVWYKYIKRLEIEQKYGDSLKSKYVMDNNDFYSREDYRKLHHIKSPYY